jgi:hypothetical protein
MTTRVLMLLVILTAIAFAVAKTPPPPPPNVQAEIEYLLQHIGTSGCSFYRNGSWYDSAQAQAHLRSKYEYLAERQLIGSAEDFIDKAATKSSLSGKPYKIRCGDHREVESGPWLHLALEQYRVSAQPGQHG